ncbi:tol-pal system protein YbgF [Zobellella maritima]|uniref:tol-pal system protein YbgF n=1 Tax=Zobellella maritima TaxID=2059725 RepID=UPI000E30925F|nr:tol-pal system protein YbgF [Zobellella maritima]
MKHNLAAISMAAVLSTSAWAQAPVSSVGSSGSVSDRLAELERGANARSQAQIEHQRQLTSLQREVSELRGLLEEQSYRLEQVVERQRSMLAAQQDAGQPAQATEPEAAAPAAPSAANGSSNQPGASSSDEQAAYDNAVNLVLQQKDYDAAIPAFARFITQYPQSEYVPNAHYWLGQLLFAQKRFDQSKAQFTRVVEAYSKSNKRPDAMLKLGVIAREQGDSASAKQHFEQVVREYAGSSAARLAEEYLAGL